MGLSTITSTTPLTIATDLTQLAQQIKQWGQSLGFAEIRISDTDISLAEPRLNAWLAQGMHGNMDYMTKHGAQLRAYPDKLVPGTLRVISARMNYLPITTVNPSTNEIPQPQNGKKISPNKQTDWRTQELAKLEKPEQATVSLYARGRDYHKVLRNKLQKLAEQIKAQTTNLGYRVFTDSAPVMEVELARKAGLGWRGKHTLLLSRDGGSMFFLGEIFVDIPLPCDPPVEEHCGHCQRCLSACPTGAIIAPYQLDARRCISYLTIEHPGSIPETLRPLMGNRIYGCDDCQLVCPWNKYAQPTGLDDFSTRNNLDHSQLLSLFAWTENDFSEKLAGSAIRRIGHTRWLRNIAIALGNALKTTANVEFQQTIRVALQTRANHPSELVREHIAWALTQIPPTTDR